MTQTQLQKFTEDYIADKVNWSKFDRDLRSEEKIIFTYLKVLDDITVPNNGNIGFFGTTPVAQQAHIADASVAHTVSGSGDDATINAALDALGAKINAIYTALENYGLLADS